MVAVERYDIIAAEVLEVLKHVEPEVKVRIPKSLIEKLENVASKDYIVELKPNKSLENQELHPETLDFLAGIYTKYLGTEVEKNEYNDRLRFEKEAEEAIKRQNVRSYEEMFDRPKEEIPVKQEENNPEENNKLIEVKEPNIFKKILNKILSIFKK